MIHIDEDRLLEYALEICPGTEKTEIAGHLAGCSRCGAELGRIQRDLQAIGGVRPRVRLTEMSGRRSRQTIVYSILRAAALIIFGIFIGYGASAWLYRAPAPVSPSYIRPSPPEDLLKGIAVSDATEVPLSYYQHILEEIE
jgi:hypothetical protein